MKNVNKLVAIILTGAIFFNCLPAYCTKYPDYTEEFIGNDRFENFNRKVFNFNLGLNKYAIRPVHIIWSSIFPEFAMDRLYGVSNNIEYPVRFVSSIIQRDFKTSKNETVRFLTNTILGVGGMFDPAKYIFKLEQSNEDMEQALAKCKIKSGPYFVAPVMSFTDVRGLCGKIFDTALNPSSYIVSPLLALIKSCLMINRTSYLQPIIRLLELTFADPYDIAKKAFGINKYIKFSNLDKIDVMSNLQVKVKDELVQEKEKSPVKHINPVKHDTGEKLVKTEVSSELIFPELLYGNVDKNSNKNFGAENYKLEADINLYGYNPQSPVVDSMRTALFSQPDKSVWNELSIWNRSFSKQLKTDYVNITDGKEPYKFRFILQKDKSSPLAIIYPSIAEGIYSSNSVALGKIFYDAGYSVLIQGSHFQWEFIKSMPDNYYPGLPDCDADALREVTTKISKHLSTKLGYDFSEKVFVGTSFGALTSLFLASKEFEHNTLGNTKYISICPPVDLIYAMRQVDKNSEEWNKLPEEFKKQTALAAAKVMKLYMAKDDIDFPINNLPFNDTEGKLVTGFIMHQKLSDLVFTLEKKQKNIYEQINNMNYQDYAKKYLLGEKTFDDIAYESSLHYISNYLRGGYNYKIYHSLNDYLTNTNQLKKLKQYTGRNTVLFDNGAHLGFLYRQEFIDDLKETISLK